MRKSRIITFVGFGMALAALAFAGSFYGDGTVWPTSGYANSTLFTYAIAYDLSPGQNPPVAYVDIYRGSTYWESNMMAIAGIDSAVVYYFYTRTLPAGSDYAFGFHTVDDSTILTLGPTVQ